MALFTTIEQRLASVLRAALGAAMLVGTGLCQALPTLTLSCLMPQDAPQRLQLEQVLGQAFLSMGYQLELAYLPTEQAIAALREGRLDGDCGRVANFNDFTGLSLVRVEQPIRNTALVPWALAGRKNLAFAPRQQLRVAFYTPGVAIESLLRKMNYQQLIPVPDTKTGFELLQSAEADLFFGYDFAIARHLAKQPSRAFVNLGAQMIIPIHLFLQPKHQRLAEELAQRLTELLEQSPIQAPTIATHATNLKPFRMVCIAEQESGGFTQIETYYRDLFAQLGYQVFLTYEPPQRAIASLRAKHYDGTCGGFEDFNRRWELTMTRVDEVSANLAITVWSNNPATEIRSIEQLAGKRVALVRGHSINPSALGAELWGATEFVSNTEIGLKMLAAGRVDAFVGFDYFIKSNINRLDLVNTVYRAGSLIQLDAYPYLQPEFEPLAAPLATLIKARGPFTNF